MYWSWTTMKINYCIQNMRLVLQMTHRYASLRKSAAILAAIQPYNPSHTFTA